MLNGSVIKGELFGDQLECRGGIFLGDNFMSPIVSLKMARLGGDLYLRDSSVESLHCDRAIVGGGLYLDNFNCRKEVRLLGVKIGSNLSCRGAVFHACQDDDLDNPGVAIACDGMAVEGSVNFSHGFKSLGVVRLQGAIIHGGLECQEALFKSGRDFDILMENSRVSNVWYLTDLIEPARVNASHAEVNVLCDHVYCWEKGSVLDGFSYEMFGGVATLNSEDRVEWLLKQSDLHLGLKGSNEFRPQPWTHLRDVLRKVGALEYSRRVGIAYEKHLREADLIGNASGIENGFVCNINKIIIRFFHWLFGFLAGYGYRPIRLLYGMFVTWLVMGVLFWIMALPPLSAIGPSDPLIFQNIKYEKCIPGSSVAIAAKVAGDASAGNWFLCRELPAEYATFSPFAFSLDVILPLVDLGQEKYWGALVSTPHFNPIEEWFSIGAGHVVRFLIWFEIMYGWVASLLLAGIVSGFARRSED